MENITILCVDDQAEVLDAVVRDLRPLQKFFRVEEAGSAEEAKKIIDETVRSGDYVGLVISDHVMPGETGVELLGAIFRDDRFSDTKKILLTGQANHADTIRAINEARIDNYFEKPWKPEDLVATAKKLLTRFILKKGIDYKDYMPILDQATLLENLRGA
ncbi:MAG: response regulator [Verrucomicrobia bacterium]|nr:response regulator [Verrucomicrobiota bacterium]